MKDSNFDEFTGVELNELDKIRDDLILWLFETKDKRFCIERSLKQAFRLGRQKK